MNYLLAVLIYTYTLQLMLVIFIGCSTLVSLFSREFVPAEFIYEMKAIAIFMVPDSLMLGAVILAIGWPVYRGKDLFARLLINYQALRCYLMDKS